MDKRWILIIIILIVGVSALYMIVSNSDTVGSAIVTFGKTTLTLPHGYSVERTDDYSVELYNKQNRNERIHIMDFGKGKYPEVYLKNMTDLQQELEDYDNISNSTTKINDVNISLVNMVNENGTDCFCAFYYQNHTYFIDFQNYKDTSNINDTLDFIMDTMHPDYKQSQD